ncbi:MAG: inositol monophosphatase [Oligoflexia bacterium]|nr:inositol monophosphatase [Oligoflexia bacterium]
MKNASNKIITEDFFYSLCCSIDSFFDLNKKQTDLGLKSESPVTEVDLNVSNYVYSHLRSFGFLDSEILSEENTSTYLEVSNRLWILDPLDGTKEFIRGIPEFSFSLAYLERHILKAGCIYNPSNKFMAIYDGINTQSMNTNFWTYDNNYILCSRTEIQDGLLLRKKLPYQILGLGSIAYKLALVAAGLAKATVSFRPKSSWDIAAGIALVEAVGGKVTDLEGGSISFTNPMIRFEKGLLASFCPDEHETILKACQ